MVKSGIKTMMIEQTKAIRQTILRIKTTVLSAGKIEVTAPQLTAGEDVEVIILLPET